MTMHDGINAAADVFAVRAENYVYDVVKHEPLESRQYWSERAVDEAYEYALSNGVSEMTPEQWAEQWARENLEP